MKQTFYSIQALRGLAASLVVIAHIFEHPSRGDPNALLLTGRFGVEIFFVISGFVMTQVAGEGSFAPGAFAFRRIMRIVPLYWVCTLLVFAVALVAPALFKTTTADVKHLVLSLFFIPAPDPQAASDWRPLFKLGWTLNYEMFFYAALLLLFWCRKRIQRSVILTVALGALVLLSFAIPPKQSILAFYANIALIPFLVGVWLAEASSLFARVPRWGIVALVAAAALSTAWLYQLPFELDARFRAAPGDDAGGDLAGRERPRAGAAVSAPRLPADGRQQLVLAVPDAYVRGGRGLGRDRACRPADGLALGADAADLRRGAGDGLLLVPRDRAAVQPPGAPLDATPDAHRDRGVGGVTDRFRHDRRLAVPARLIDDG